VRGPPQGGAPEEKKYNAWLWWETEGILFKTLGANKKPPMKKKKKYKKGITKWSGSQGGDKKRFLLGK